MISIADNTSGPRPQPPKESLLGAITDGKGKPIDTDTPWKKELEKLFKK